MSVPKIFFTSTVVLFAVIFGVAIFKKQDKLSLPMASVQKEQEIAEVIKEPILEGKEELIVATSVVEKDVSEDLEDEVIAFDPPSQSAMPTVDRVHELFSKGTNKLPIVETITYTSRVPWLKGRAAWVADYASHFNTSRHFIARSLNGKTDYITQKVVPGDQFNVFSPSKNFEFLLLVDLSSCQMHFYYVDLDREGEKTLIKTYPVGVGRKIGASPSGSLTPVGTYLLGDKVAVYNPGIYGFFQNQRTEMIRVFGTRWLPFKEEVGECSDSAKGYGLHGMPCSFNEETGELIEEEQGVGSYSSDGCLRLRNVDMEEIFAIVVGRPTKITIMKQVSTDVGT